MEKEEEIELKKEAVNALITGLRTVQILLLFVVVIAALGILFPTAYYGYLLAAILGLYFEHKLEKKIRAKEKQKLEYENKRKEEMEKQK